MIFVLYCTCLLACSELKIWEWRAILLVIHHPYPVLVLVAFLFSMVGGAGKRGEKGENLRFGNGAISFAPRPG